MYRTCVQRDQETFFFLAGVSVQYLNREDGHSLQPCVQVDKYVMGYNKILMYLAFSVCKLLVCKLFSFNSKFTRFALYADFFFFFFCALPQFPQGPMVI